MMDSVPAPPQVASNIQPKISMVESLGPGPMEKSAMIMQVGSEKKSSEKAGAGASSEERAAPTLKV